MLTQQSALKLHCFRSVRHKAAQHDGRYITGAFFSEDLTTISMSVPILFNYVKFTAANPGSKALDGDAPNKTCSRCNRSYYMTAVLHHTKLHRLIAHITSRVCLEGIIASSGYRQIAGG